ncbi:MAG: hypothetical protein RLZZ546_1318 [Bacteroidota bacterium]|jgi:hypothetical protein
MTQEEKDEILNTYKWIKVKMYKRENYEDWKDAYEALEAHHVEETEFLLKKLREIVEKYC